ncbi:Substrate-specific component PdxU2 of predicted pyridoxin-related ECF transporter [Anaerovibrio sp. JC8]|nr:Substrate-specific component PdxU2 of predicted pyridoxin-related ECF transporter [Anaerovibrio sp. JC8]
MSTIVFLMTFVPKIPIPLGYAHVGDAAIFLIVLLAPKRPALLAACIGSAMADLIGGFYLWIMPTIFIKFIMAYIVYIIARPDGENTTLLRAAAAFVVASLWMTFGYVAFGALLYDSLEAGLASGYGLLVKSLINTIAALLALPSLRKAINLNS